MKKLIYFGPALVLALALSACSGISIGTGNQNSTISGRVLDLNSVPVRDARVWADGQEVRTSTTGAYYLENVSEGEVEIRAEINQNGTIYRGQTWVYNFDGEQRNNGTIIVGPSGQLGSVRGTVRDRDGFLLQGVSVFAYNGAGSSARAFTDEDGEYEINELVGGFQYEIRAMGQGYRSDTDVRTIQSGTTITSNLILGDPGTPTLSPPSNLSAITWTSQTDATRSAGSGKGALAWAKDHFGNGKETKKVAESRTNSNVIVEVELEWDEQRFDDHLGWGIYRATSAAGPLNGLDFFADPLSAYYFDATVIENRTYSYAVSTLSAEYPDFPNFTESNLSNRAVAETLGVLNLNNPTFGPVTIRWQSGSGADEYIVYIFDTFPGIGVGSVWDNESNPTSGFSLSPNYSFNSGQTYYYLVLGIANGIESRTLSQIGTFVP